MDIFFRGDAHCGGGWGCGDNFMGALLANGMTNGALENYECFSVCGLRRRWFRGMAVAWNGRGENVGND
jgi:hypothetical protein